MPKRGASLRSVSLSLVLALAGVALATSACKSVEDLPEEVPIEDDWVDQIEAEEPAPADGIAVAGVPEAGESAVAPVPGEDAAEGQDTEGAPAGDTQGEVAAEVAAGDPGTGEAAKVMAAPSTSGGGGGGGAATSPTPEAGEVAAGSEGAAEAAPAEPAVAPAPAPEPAKPAPPPPITAADFGGNYSFTGGSAQRQTLAEAIEDAAMQVPGIIRGIARKRLGKTQIIETPMTITVSGSNIRFDLGTTGGNWAAEIDGPTTSMKYNGDKYKVKVRFKDGKMITVFMDVDATKTVVYTMSSDRKRLTAHHRLVADQLDTPMTFKVSYTRK